MATIMKSHVINEVNVTTALNIVPDDRPGGVLVVNEVDEAVWRGGDGVLGEPVVVGAPVGGVEAAEPHHAASIVEDGLLWRMVNIQGGDAECRT